MNERMSIGGAGGGGPRRQGGDNALVRLAKDHGIWDDANTRDRVIDLFVQNRVLGMLRQRMAEAAQEVASPARSSRC